MADYSIKMGEARIDTEVQITVTKDDAAVDITSATLTFTVRQNRKDTSALFTVENSSFTKSDPTNGIATFPLTAANTKTAQGLIYGELEVVIGNDIWRSADIEIELIDAITEDS